MVNWWLAMETRPAYRLRPEAQHRAAGRGPRQRAEGATLKDPARNYNVSVTTISRLTRTNELRGPLIIARVGNMNDLQTVFLVFYAIFWGYIAGVQPHWKASYFPLVCRIPQARHRTGLAVIILNFLPLIFWYVMWALAGPQLHKITPALASVDYVIRGVLPAVAVFGFYRW
jgi:hypothetical protein